MAFNHSARSPSEIIFKTIAIASTTSIAAGHLTTLRRVSRQDRADALIAVLGSFFVPVLPFASLLRGTWGSLRLLRHQRAHAGFYLAVALGVRATIIGGDEDTMESVPLLNVEYKELVWRHKEYDSRWLGRLMVLLLFGAQTVMTVILVMRRTFRGDEGGFALSSWDLYNGFIALGGVGTAIASIGVTMLNTSWQVESAPRAHTWTGRGTDSRVLMTFFDVGVAPEAKGAAEELRLGRILLFLLALPLSGEWLGSTLRSHMDLEKLPFLLPTDVNSEVNRFPEYLLGSPGGLLALRTAIGGILFLPVILLFDITAGRATPLGKSSHFWKWNAFIHVMFRVFLNVYALMAIFFHCHWLVVEMMSLVDSREKGEWLEIMWVDPWAAKLYAI